MDNPSKKILHLVSDPGVVIDGQKIDPDAVIDGQKIDPDAVIGEFITEAVNEYHRMTERLCRRLKDQNENSPHHKHTDPDGLLRSIQPYQLAIFSKKKFLEDQPEKRGELIELIVQYYRESTRSTLTEKEKLDRITLLVNITPFEELGDIINETNRLLKKAVAVG